MANNINWGENYCDILSNDAFGDYAWSANAINDVSAPTCWAGGLLPFTVDTTFYKTDTTLYTTDRTQI